MKCLRKYQWVKLPRDIPDMGKGLMAYWAMLAFRAAFRKGNASYCGHSNPVAPGMWAGGVVGLKSILGVRSRTKALQILGELSSLGFLKYSLDSQTKSLTGFLTADRKDIIRFGFLEPVEEPMLGGDGHFLGGLEHMAANQIDFEFLQIHFFTFQFCKCKRWC